MTSDNKVPELGINRFGGNRSMAPLSRLEQQQNMSAQALLNTNTAFPMSFIDPNQAAQYNQLVSGGLNLAPTQQALVCLPNISASG